MLRSGLNDGAAESIAGHHDDIEALFHGALDHSHTVSGIIAGGLIILELDFVLLGESLAGLIGGLVEGLVGDVTVVGDHSDLVLGFVLVLVTIAFLFAAGKEGQGHNKSQEQSKILFHV